MNKYILDVRFEYHAKFEDVEFGQQQNRRNFEQSLFGSEFSSAVDFEEQSTENDTG